MQSELENSLCLSESISIMHNSFRLIFCTIGIVTLLTLQGCTLQKNLDNANIELKKTQQHLQEVQSQLKDSKQEIQNLHQRLNKKNLEIAIMSICLEGVGRALSNMGDGDRSRAFLELASVVRECGQADKIAEKTRLELNQVSSPLETDTPVSNVNQWTSSKSRQQLK
ncbi:hypothetical protein BZZ01_30835 [Nostocales cyanobacterium HT-58-2]|nr:hypothetical protein BZZ01_30835 [Nostocales cyanobacterium HT-58-2]